MSILVSLTVRLESLQNEVEDLTDRGTKRQQKRLPGVIAECERIYALQSKAAELAMLLDPSYGDLGDLFDAVDDLIEDGAK
jgi:hypothetical protein